jgi:hypothetical protein
MTSDVDVEFVMVVVVFEDSFLPETKMSFLYSTVERKTCYVCPNEALKATLQHKTGLKTSTYLFVVIKYA